MIHQKDGGHVGKTISHYKILEKLGEGGMGVVYKAEDLKLKRSVALKFLPPELTRDPKAKERFILEAQAASALDHPNICNIHEIDETEEGQMFICMAYYEGETLKEKIEHGPLKLDAAIDIAIQIALGLAKAHEQGIVHRDIKPANIHVTDDGVAKILDFGLAKLRGRSKLTKEGTTLGTVVYTSPEQSRGEDVNHRTDIWSVGVVLYEMIVGQLPFKGEYEQSVVYSILNVDPEPMTGLRTGVPMELERISNKAMAKRPEERYQHVDEMLVDLKALRTQTETGKSKELLPATKVSKRNPFYVYSGIAVMLALVIWIIVYLIPGNDDVIDSIAVLPLHNLSGDPEQEYFADGMTEALITELSKIGALRVISRQSIMRFKGSNESLPDIAKKLNVVAIVEGSLLFAGEKVRITTQLVKAVPEKHLWAEDYERDPKDILALQKEVTRAIAHEIKVAITPEEQAQLIRARTVNPETYQLYLKGRYHWNKRTEEGLKKSIEYFQQAIEKAAALIENKGKDAFAEFRKENSEWFTDETYIFVTDMKGTNIVHPSQPELEGKNLIDMKDVDGKAFIQEMIEVAKTKGSGWIDYMWPKPGETEPSRKLSYIKVVKVDSETLIIGAGIYSD